MRQRWGSLLGGCVIFVAGFYAGVAVALAPSWEVPYVRENTLLALAAVLASGAVVAASMWLERVCRLPPDSSTGPKP